MSETNMNAFADTEPECVHLIHHSEYTITYIIRKEHHLKMGGRKGELIQRLIQFGMENCTTYTSTQASNHNPSVSNPSVANLCDVLPTYTSSQAFDPNQTVSNASGIHPLSMDQAPPRDPPRSNAPNHPIR
eukprot:921992_1